MKKILNKTEILELMNTLSKILKKDYWKNYGRANEGEERQK